jgi:hypothetical protein
MDKHWTWSLLVVSLLVVLWARSDLWAQGVMVNGFTITDAVVQIEGQGEVVDLGGQEIACTDGAKVGIWARGIRSLTNVTVRGGCAYGVIALPGEETIDAQGQTVAAQPIEVQHVTVQAATQVCFWLGSGSASGGGASFNQASHCSYGFYLAGNKGLYTNNISTDNTVDGFLITGDGNRIESNEAYRNAKTGFRLARMVPAIGDGITVGPLGDPALWNIIRYNTAQQNGIDFRDNVENCATPGWNNTYTGNIFTTKQPSCLK